jgi:hypothetical protein
MRRPNRAETWTRRVSPGSLVRKDFRAAWLAAFLGLALVIAVVIWIALAQD